MLSLDQAVRLDYIEVWYVGLYNCDREYKKIMILWSRDYIPVLVLLLVVITLTLPLTTEKPALADDGWLQQLLKLKLPTQHLLGMLHIIVHWRRWASQCTSFDLRNSSGWRLETINSSCCCMIMLCHCWFLYSNASVNAFVQYAAFCAKQIKCQITKSKSNCQVLTQPISH